MRFTSLIVELIRARPRLIFWIAAGLHAVGWLIAALLFFDGPPGDLAQTLAIGREYQLGSAFGPPLAYWLADLAYRAAFGHIIGVYLLARLCQLAAFYALFQLGRLIVGASHAALAVLLTMTVTAFGAPSLAFGPEVLAQPLLVFALLHSWRAIGLNQPQAWPLVGLLFGLLLLTSLLASWSFVLLLIFALASARGRRSLLHPYAAAALLVMLVVALPYLLWLGRAFASPTLTIAAAQEHAMLLARNWAPMLGWLLLSAAGLLFLCLLNIGRAEPLRDAAVITRPKVDPLGRAFIAVFTFVPVIAVSGFMALGRQSQAHGAEGVALLLVGLMAIVLGRDALAIRREHLQRQIWLAAVALPLLVVAAYAVLLPWFRASDPHTSLPAKDIGTFFATSFERRMGRPLEVVAGDPQLAALVAMSKPRPHLLLDADPSLTPWTSIAAMRATGGVVVWRARDTIGMPPPELAARFPGLVPELPRAFDRLVNGREPVLRIGWAIVRPTPPKQ